MLLFRAVFAFAAAVGFASPGLAQTTPRSVEAFEKICIGNARDATALAELAGAAGGAEAKNPLWPDYKNDGYPEKAFVWADAPNLFVFTLTSRWTNVPPKCTLFIRQAQSDEVATLVAKMVALDSQIEGGIAITVSDHGQYMMLTQGPKQFRGEVTLDKNRKFGEFALLSFSRSMSYKPPAAVPAQPAAPSATIE